MPISCEIAGPFGIFRVGALLFAVWTRRRMVRQVVQRVALMAGVDRVMRRLHRDRLIILMYHGFVDEAEASEPPRGVQVGLNAFLDQLRYVVRNHTIVSLGDWLHAVRNHLPLPPAPLAITIDDGYESVYRLAFPILRAQRIPATLAITTGFVDGAELLWNDRVEWALQHGSAQAGTVNLGSEPVLIECGSAWQRRATTERVIDRLKQIPQEGRANAVTTLERYVGASLPDAGSGPAHYRPLSWSQTQEMVDSGLISLANHTRSHYILSRCSAKEEVAQIEDAHEAIRAHVADECRTFCFPNGEPGDFTERTIAHLRERGYEVGLTTSRGANTRAGDAWHLKRIPVIGTTTNNEFRLLLYGGLRGLRRDLLDVVHRRGD